MTSVPGTQAVSRSLRVLRAVARHHKSGINLAKLTRETGLNKPTAHRLLMALMAEGMVEQDERSFHYFVGPECHMLGVIANERYGLGRAAADAVARLAHLCEDSAFWSIRSDAYAVCVLREDGDYPLKTHVLQPGVRHPLGVGAGSLAMLAALEDADAERHLATNARALAKGYPRYSADMLRAEVRATRKRGYAVNQGLIVPGSWGLGAAVRASNGDVIGALSIAAVESRLQKTRQRELGPPLSEEARLLEKQVERMPAIRKN